MPRVKNVSAIDCKACHQRVTYEYAIHRKTFLHKLNSARYAPNGSMIYNDSVDLDKTAEHINVQTLQQQYKEADAIGKSVKQQLRTQKQNQEKHKKSVHANFVKNRKTAANLNKHLQPKQQPNVLQRKLDYEAELIYQQQMANFLQRHPQQSISDNDDDLQDFILTPRAAKRSCMQTLEHRPKKLLLSNLPSFASSDDIVPLFNSTQMNNTYNSDIQITSNFNNCNVPTIALPNNSIALSNTNINHSITINISDIPLPSVNAPTNTGIYKTPTKHTATNTANITLPQENFTTTVTNNNPTNTTAFSNDSRVSYFDPNKTEDISFYTSCIAQPSNLNSHIRHNSPIKSPITTDRNIQNFQLRIAPQYCLRRITCVTDYDNSVAICRNCCVDINYNKLMLIPQLLPSGKQTFCAECLLTMVSRRKDTSVDFYYKRLV